MESDFDKFGFPFLWKILAIKDRMFFICEDDEEGLAWVTVVAVPNAVVKHFNLTLPVVRRPVHTRSL